jgi:penicillin-insensitive murein DD-endopeptidase
MKTCRLTFALLLALAQVSIPHAVAQTAQEQASLAALAGVGLKKAAVDLKRTAAKSIFGAERLPADLPARAIGSYARGCLSGAKALPVNGPAWQVMRTSRNRNWAHPAMLNLIERLAADARKNAGWNGLLVGDMAQPRGGPMLTGHASHQIGLDADIWFTPMPDHELTDKERENLVPVEMVKDRSTLNRDNWTESRAKLIKTAASYPEVARIFVNPPIKAELCKWATGDRSWLAKVRPYYNHTFHFHVRMSCPPGFAGCKNQWPVAPKDGTGCGEELAYWMGPVPWAKKKRDPNAPPIKPAPPLTLASLPAECRAVVTAP